ncbi:nuclease-related domain-containing protein [Salicibibacter kimchii]|uniref:NERD domain-containing protein n=1 Tax=Salicibibacter kimchii TaxID=2099786 RepID=A0A345BW16_9BACI|nr:nuclease-related domain-containing protein [Salicibibacter kimchii]AXF55147.1 NERD domain-containing protein [Salicibibacter kimchii]
MNLKDREEPIELKYFRFLKGRMFLSSDEKQQYANVQKGFEGEVKFDRWIEQNLSCDYLLVKGLLLEHRGELFQIDTLLIFSREIYLFNVKNHVGDYYSNEDKWHFMSGAEIKSPLLQLQRSDFLLQQLLRKLETNTTIKPSLVFIHPEFILYNAPPKLPVLFSGQLNRFKKTLNSKPSKIDRKHERLAERLVSLHLDHSPHTRWPDYDFQQLKKGVTCIKCATFMSDKERKWKCTGCGHEEDNETAILRNAKEYHFLFPDKKMITNVMSEWCEINGSKKKIRRVLSKHFRHLSQGRGSYYV